ncbi:SulP family inorganic anion transporter [Pseudodesulfovibrio sp.]|uniref:SulP family inorganic anion transporter n=1 Tax=unclassified Pseudodesulfovibrio TaxID=2661612 RepID=UPI003AFF7A93
MTLVPALFSCLRKGYSPQSLIRDLGSGITVGIVALPLAMAFAIASGATPEQGLFTSIVAGFIISAFGGSRFQIGGPTGAFVVIVASVIARHGYQGLVVTMLLAGVWLILMGVFNFGQFLRFIPYPVVTGFTSGIALLIVTTQIKDFFGLGLASAPSDFIGRIAACAKAMPTFSLTALSISLGTLLIMILVRRFVPRIPAHIVGIFFATVATWGLHLPIETIGSHFGGIPAQLPHLQYPALGLDTIRELLPESFTIALLAGIESLLSAVVADGMTGERHSPSMELVAQGFANIASALFGGIPATGAIARTATNIRAGAYSPVSGIIHVLTLVAFVMCCSSLLYHIPLASLAAILVFVAWDMSDLHRFKRLLHAPKADSAVLLITFSLTVFVDLTVAVQVGVVLAALLFMKRMSDVGSVCEVSMETEPDTLSDAQYHGQIARYKVEGPFFFGMAQRFVDTMQFTRTPPKVLIITLAHVYHIDATAIEALESVIEKARKTGTAVVLSDLNEGVGTVLRAMGTKKLVGPENLCQDYPSAVFRAKCLILEQARAEMPEVAKTGRRALRLTLPRP